MTGTPPLSPSQELAEGQRLDKIRRPERIEAAKDAFEKVLGKPHYMADSQGNLGRDLNVILEGDFDKRLDALTHSGKLTVHQAALQAVKETLHGAKDLGNTDALVVKFDDTYHQALHTHHIPQLPHSLHPQAGNDRATPKR